MARLGARLQARRCRDDGRSTHDMPLREIAFVVEPLIANEAKGVMIRRTIGSERLAMLDPFMLLDHLTVEAPVDGRVGFPRHPHRGIETLSYVIDGRVYHKDSLGTEDSVGKDEAQWMTAGRGIWHEEMLEADQGKVEMLQLWFALPKADKMIAPQYSPGRNLKVVDSEGTAIRDVSWAFETITGSPDVKQVDLSDSVFETEVSATATTAFYVFRGSVSVEGREVEAGRLAVLTSGERVRMSGTGRVLFISAEPLREPILQYRSFVMNAPDDIRDVEAEIKAGTFGLG